MAAHLVGLGAVPRTNVQPGSREGGDDVVLRRFRIAARHGAGGAAGAQHEREVSGFASR